MRQVMNRPFDAALPPTLYDQRVEQADQVENRLELIGKRCSGALNRIFTGRSELQTTVA